MVGKDEISNCWWGEEYVTKQMFPHHAREQFAIAEIFIVLQYLGEETTKLILKEIGLLRQYRLKDLLEIGSVAKFDLRNFISFALNVSLSDSFPCKRHAGADRNWAALQLRQASIGGV
jgi:hypothetical protein